MTCKNGQKQKVRLLKSTQSKYGNKNMYIFLSHNLFHRSVFTVILMKLFLYRASILGLFANILKKRCSTCEYLNLNFLHSLFWLNILMNEKDI